MVTKPVFVLTSGANQSFVLVGHADRFGTPACGADLTPALTSGPRLSLAFTSGAFFTESLIPSLTLTTASHRQGSYLPASNVWAFCDDCEQYGELGRGAATESAVARRLGRR